MFLGDPDPAHDRFVVGRYRIPTGEVQQVAHIPVAYTKGTSFKPGLRKPMDQFVHHNGW